jgi:hypothetical protein
MARRADTGADLSTPALWRCPGGAGLELEAKASLRPAPPLPLRAASRLLDALGLRGADLSPERMRRRAELATGLHEWGDDGFGENLELACRAVRDHPNLSPVGRIGVATYYHFHLVNRLRLVALDRREPAIRGVPVEKPLFIVGLYRTATTALHGLLAEDPRHRAPLTWELLCPTPLHPNARLDRQLRRLRVGLMLWLNRVLIPDQKYAHAVELDGPEECFFMLENHFTTSTLFNTFQAHAYAFDLLERDLRPSYRDERFQLQVLSWRREPRDWILKSPFHLWHLDDLLDVFPDARIVFTHRDVTRALPSNCSLSAMTTTKFGRAVDLQVLGDFWRHYYRAGIDRFLGQRMDLPKEQVFDVPPALFDRDPEAAVEAIYDHFGWTVTPGFRTRMRAHLQREASRRRLPHRYSLAMFGLDRAGIEREFADYSAYMRALDAQAS